MRAVVAVTEATAALIRGASKFSPRILLGFAEAGWKKSKHLSPNGGAKW